MKQLVLLFVLFPAFLWAQDSSKLLPDSIRAKQIADMRFGMFICWSFSTFSGQEWTPTEAKDASFFKATGCNTDQWCEVAKSADMKYILFLTKHHDGFCLWDTKTTEKKVTNSPIGIDVLAKLRKSCDKYGLKLALYFSEGDWTFPGAEFSKSGGKNPEVKKAQLKELLTNYGPIEFIWFDHAQGDGGLSHEETDAWVARFQPNCLPGYNHGTPAGKIRLGERGYASALNDVSGAGYNKEAGSYNGYIAAEFTYPIVPAHKGGADWFYSLPAHDTLCLSAQDIYTDYLGAVKYGNIFSLDVGPDYRGEIRAVDVKTLAEVGELIRSGNVHFSPAANRNDRISRWESLKFGAFVHFNDNACIEQEISKNTDHGVFNPQKLDFNAMMSTLQKAGVKYAVLTTRHTSGFCLWDSKTTRFDVASSPYKRDVVRMFVDACRMHDIKPCFYYCMWGNKDWNPASWNPTIRKELEGTSPKMTILTQLSELAENYGDIFEFWIDMQCWADTTLSAQETYDLLKSKNPGTIVHFNQHVQDGTKIVYFPTDIVNGEERIPPSSGHDPNRDVAGKRYYLPFEYEITSQRYDSLSLGNGLMKGSVWFTYPQSHFYPVDSLYRYIRQSYDRGGSNILLSTAPEKSGEYREADCDSIIRLGGMIKAGTAVRE
jgi:alpha-L-fucosidase